MHGELGKEESLGSDWVCECGAHLDRDGNAATNLLMLAARSAESQDAGGRDLRLRLASASVAIAEETGTCRIRPALRPRNVCTQTDLSL
ncbi:zinc ribbon domain-containing protein [Salinibacterium sp. ZJ70]|uniref:zinc ribbon domain-containing protein n=1 Tax=Salinibacterium sp. ZJ70 TaxID=2708084 RepID=UPI00141EBF67